LKKTEKTEESFLSDHIGIFFVHNGMEWK